MTYTFKCAFCGTEASSTQEKAKFCSPRCRGESYLKKSGRVRAFPIPSGTTGAIAELEVSAYLMKNSYSVFRALSPSCFCDLLAFKDGSISAVEVRTAYRALSGKLCFPKNTRPGVDLFGLYIPTTNEVVMIPVKEVI